VNLNEGPLSLVYPGAGENNPRSDRVRKTQIRSTGEVPTGINMRQAQIFETGKPETKEIWDFVVWNCFEFKVSDFGFLV
jgi:hypothetical protein